MNAYEDTLKAFDEVIVLLTKDPHREPITVDGKELYALRHQGEYGNALHKASETLRNTLNHLIHDGLVLPDTYSWRRFCEVVEASCMFDIDTGGGFGFDKAGQQEVHRVITTARDELINLHEESVEEPKPKAQSKQHPVKKGDPSLKSRQRSPVRWPLELLFAGGLATLWAWKFPNLFDFINSNRSDTFVVGWMATTISVFMMVIAFVNKCLKGKSG